MKWNNNNSSSSSKGVFLRPYTAYTIYWRLERTYLLQQAGIIDDVIKSSYDHNHYDQLELPRPDKYADVILPPYWYSSAQRNETEKRRKHRKREGSISKNKLTKLIAKSWREIDQEVLDYVNKLAKAEKAKYLELKKKEEKGKKPESTEVQGVMGNWLPEVVSCHSVSMDPGFFNEELAMLTTNCTGDAKNSSVYNDVTEDDTLKSDPSWIESEDLFSDDDFRFDFKEGVL